MSTTGYFARGETRICCSEDWKRDFECAREAVEPIVVLGRSWIRISCFLLGSEEVEEDGGESREP